jgi:hypothetical protein
MLIRYSLENFRSIQKRQELSLVASSLKGSTESLIEVRGLTHPLVKIASIYGANASGKTNVIRGLSYISSVIRDSHRRWEPGKGTHRNPFRLDKESLQAPSKFEVAFIVDRVRYEYGFSLDSEQFIEEWLYAFPKNKRQIWYERSRDKFIFGSNFSGENKSIESLTRPNSLFLSAAAQNNHPLLTPLYSWFSEQVHFVRGPRESEMEFSAHMCTHDDLRDLFRNLVQTADLGVTDICIKPTEKDKELEQLVANIRKAIGRDVEIRQPLTGIQLLHKSGQEDVALSIGEESAGTRAYFALLGPVLATLASGGLLCIDELDSSLHPLLSSKVLELFTNPKLNKRGGQLIFNTHDTNLLCAPELRRDQIWFTERDASGATHLYPLSDFKPRQDENLQRGYLQGRYGAVPFLGRTDFLRYEESDGETTKTA